MSKSEIALKKLSAGDYDESVFEAAFPEVVRLVRGYLAWYGAGEDVLEECSQEVVVRVHVSRESRKGGNVASFKWWLRMICRNLMVDRARRAAIRKANRPERSQQTSDPEVLEALEHCMRGLQEPDGTILRIRHLCEWSTPEIAELYGWTRRYCEKILARARQAMLGCMAAQGYEQENRRCA